MSTINASPMITNRQKRIIYWLLRAGLWKEGTRLRSWRVYPKFGTRWLYNYWLKRQTFSDLKHAPACPANHWHKQELVLFQCNCGAQYYSDHFICFSCQDCFKRLEIHFGDETPAPKTFAQIKRLSQDYDWDALLIEGETLFYCSEHRTLSEPGKSHSVSKL